MSLHNFAMSSCHCLCVMGVDHGGTGGTRPPRIWSKGTITQIVPRRFCHISTKMSVLWPSENAKIRFWPGLRPGLRWGVHELPQSAEDGTPLRIPYPTRHQSTFGPGHAFPQNSSQIYAYAVCPGEVRKLLHGISLDRT